MLDLSNTWEASDLDKFGTFAIPVQIGLDIAEGLKEVNNGYYEKEFMGVSSEKYFTKEQNDINKEIFAGKLITRFLLPDQSLRNIVNIYDRETRSLLLTPTNTKNTSN
eukprot:TRINITY_DN17001_c0_g1_i1.p1 TRINITY_DN17001_c0_g1~~TRINITY_DN17001_c0_g1_i1.p1  ORF type:complete len:108 (-),score=10.17 TRINITY_DN17001_c0_g1_i1:152-475(-)